MLQWGKPREDSQIVTRLIFSAPQTEVVILGQVEDISQIFPDEEIYQQIQRVEIFTFSTFEPSIQGCYERFRGTSRPRFIASALCLTQRL